jgi:putative transcriptional regulator
LAVTFYEVSELAPGLLVAAPPLGDPNFDQSVVLLAAHGPEGAFGWVINGRDVMTIEDLVDRAEIERVARSIAGNVRIAGPVAREQVWLVYRTEHRLDGFGEQFDVGPGITASPSRKLLEAVASGRAPESLVGLMGYAGWAPAQLENEIRMGAWLPTDADASLLFDVPRDEVWQRSFERMGTTPIAFTTRTVGSA